MFSYLAAILILILSSVNYEGATNLKSFKVAKACNIYTSRSLIFISQKRQSFVYANMKIYSNREMSRLGYISNT